jgi:hypothetical protein
VGYLLHSVDFVICFAILGAVDLGVVLFKVLKFVLNHLEEAAVREHGSLAYLEIGYGLEQLQMPIAALTKVFKFVLAIRL